MKYQILLILEDDYVILNDNLTKVSAKYMLDWYEHHQKFFNGRFEIKEDN